MYRLTSNDLKIISVIQADSRLPVAKIAAKTKMRHHSVVYCLKQLTDRKIIRPYILTNPHALGLTDYCVFFNYIGEEKGARQKIINYCNSSQQVAYFAELTGPYQFTISLFCRTVFEVTDFFTKLSAILPKSAFHTSFALRLEFTQFTGKLYDRKAAPVILSRTQVKNETVIDETDRRIIAYYSQNASAPLRKVAEFAKTSESTVRNRLQVLEKQNVIHSYAYLVDNNMIGLTTFRIIFSANGLNNTFRNSVVDFMKKHPYASAFVQCAGSWDYELNFDVPENSLIGKIIEEVSDYFSGKIRILHTLNEINIHRAHHFPLNAGITSI